MFGGVETNCNSFAINTCLDDDIDVVEKIFILVIYVSPEKLVWDFQEWFLAEI